jgi:hypothetical protein
LIRSVGYVRNENRKKLLRYARSVLASESSCNVKRKYEWLVRHINGE